MMVTGGRYGILALDQVSGGILDQVSGGILALDQVLGGGAGLVHSGAGPCCAGAGASYASGTWYPDIACVGQRRVDKMSTSTNV